MNKENKTMYVAVNKDGKEYIYNSKPYRGKAKVDWSRACGAIPLPKGSIAKLIGRELTWSDEPVELVETKDKE